MRMYTKAILSLYPESKFIIENEDIDRIRWFGDIPEDFSYGDDEGKKQILLDKLNEELDRIELEESKLEYQRNRKVEYPPLADLADALYWQAQGDETKMTAYLAAVEAVKQKYPKGV